MHGVTPEPPAGSEHYREGWRTGYEQARAELAKRLDVGWGAERAELIELRARIGPECTGCVTAADVGMPEHEPRVVHAHPECPVHAQLAEAQAETGRLRDRDEAAKAAVEAWREPDHDQSDDLRDALDALARAHETGGQDR